MAVCEYVKGSCDFVVVHRVTTYTSGTELRGRAVHWGDFPSEMDASLALANAPEKFTRKGTEWMAQGGHTTASVSRVVLYDYPNGIALREAE